MLLGLTNLVMRRRYRPSKRGIFSPTGEWEVRATRFLLIVIPCRRNDVQQRMTTETDDGVVHLQSTTVPCPLSQAITLVHFVHVCLKAARLRPNPHGRMGILARRGWGRPCFSSSPTMKENLPDFSTGLDFPPSSISFHDSKTTYEIKRMGVWTEAPRKRVFTKANTRSTTTGTLFTAWDSGLVGIIVVPVPTRQLRRSFTQEIIAHIVDLSWYAPGPGASAPPSCRGGRPAVPKPI